MPETEEIEINTLSNGLPGISKVIGKHLVEGCMICLHRSKHNSTNTLLSVKGDEDIVYKLNWSDEVTEQIDKSWKDQEYATEHGAVCIAVKLVLALTNYTIIERSYKKTGFDYWLGEKADEPLFNNKARLEVSGIFKGTNSDVERRVKIKLEQTNQSDSFEIPAFISVIEFSTPLANFVTKK